MQKISHQDLYEHYITNGMPASKIASKFDISLSSVRHALARYGIKKEYDYHEKKSKFNPAFKGVLDKDFLIENIIKQGKSISMVMKEYTLSRNKITGALKKHGVEVPRYLSIKNGERLAILANKELLEKLHYDKKMTKTQIAKKFGSTLLTVTKLFEKFGIKAINYKPRESYILRSKRKKEIQQQKALEKEINRKRHKKCGYKHSPRTIIRQKINGMWRIAKCHRLNRPELLMKDILEGLGKRFYNNDPIICLDDDFKFLSTCCVDFRVQRSGKAKYEIVIFVDGRWHHNSNGIPQQDKVLNYYLTRFERYVVIRIWHDDINKDNVERLIKAAYKAKKPEVFCLYYPEEYIGVVRPPEEYIKKQKEIVHHTPPEVKDEKKIW